MGGRVPDWYPVIATARWLGVPPWELIKRPIWRSWAEAARGAENQAIAIKAERAQRDARARSR